MSRTILVTGGAGFIGSALVRHLLSETDHTVVNVDKLTYAGNLDSLEPALPSPRYHFEQVDICDADAVGRVLTQHRPDAIMHLAAESHVDRSIDGAGDFIRTNIVGTYSLLEAARALYGTLQPEEREQFRFVHVSTDEVFGSLGSTGYFTEETPYDPRSPYSATKASSDHLVRAWHHTYGLPVLVTNCSNNYGPYQFPEKLIPVVILSALQQKAIPVYGDGANVRDWLFVEDHVRALVTVLERGAVGETYNIGGNSERSNLEVVRTVCALLNDAAPRGAPYERLITFVKDRPGHDRRYAIDAAKIRTHLGWEPSETFETGLRRTVAWYLQNGDWCEGVMSSKYKLERLGLAGASA